jgi:hypothetical protein
MPDTNNVFLKTNVAFHPGQKDPACAHIRQPGSTLCGMANPGNRYEGKNAQKRESLSCHLPG